MRIALRQLALLRMPLAILIAVVAAGWTFVSYSGAALEETQTRLRARTAELEEARRRFQRSDEERAAILRYMPAYRQLQTEGFIGAEHRIDWIDALRAADKQAGLFGIQYQIEPQVAFDGEELAGGLSARLHRSPMRLSFGVTHELQLLTFLKALAAQRAGLFALRACSLAPSSDAPAPRKPNLRAECRIDWLTISPPDRPKT
ncbi:MAG TPA: hypothetical protein VFB20_02370 [Burkholderiales bacterium]|nr:hypothetical protein [Burkholderiales bacterium]